MSVAHARFMAARGREIEPERRTEIAEEVLALVEDPSLAVLFATAVLALFAAALSASAYQVTSPNNQTGWSSSGSNTLTWTRVEYAVFLGVDMSIY